MAKKVILHLSKRGTEIIAYPRPTTSIIVQIALSDENVFIVLP